MMKLIGTKRDVTARSADPLQPEKFRRPGFFGERLHAARPSRALPYQTLLSGSSYTLFTNAEASVLRQPGCSCLSLAEICSPA